MESRCFYAVDRAGITYSAMQARGETEVKRSAHYPKPGRPGISGIIPDALDKLVTALLGVQIPVRSGRG